MTGKSTDSAESYGILVRESLAILGYLWGPKGIQGNPDKEFRSRRKTEEVPAHPKQSQGSLGKTRESKGIL